jgi:tetratricopeptide (TPR) repeat protein
VSSPLLPRLALSLLVALAAGPAFVGCNGAEETPEEEAAKDPEEQLDGAKKAADGGNTDQAIRNLSNAVRANPGDMKLRFELARLQYEVGELEHQKERRAFRAAAVFKEQGRRDEAAANQRESNDHRARATPYYQAARDNLRVVVDEEDDDHRAAWASYLLMRCEVFFAEWEEALVAIQRAIERGRPTGQQLQQYRDFEAGIKERVKSYRGGVGP